MNQRVSRVLTRALLQLHRECDLLAHVISRSNTPCGAAFSVDVSSLQHSFTNIRGFSSRTSLDQWLRNASTRPGAARRLARAAERAAQQAKPPTAVTSDTVAVQPEERAPSLPEVANVVGHSALVVARPIEWGAVLLGFEQANRYTVYDQDGTIVAHLLEDEGSLGRAVGRQILRTRRPFTATVLTPQGDAVLFRIRRPAYLVSSTMFIEDGNGQRLGEVQQRWHLWRRRYDLFMGTRQFASIDGGLLAWEFELKDRHGGTLALIDRNFSGFGKEMFTDAGKYVIHFGEQPMEAAHHLRNAIQAAHPDRAAPRVTALAKMRTNAEVIPTSSGDQLVVSQPLGLDQRLIALAAAVSIDYDFFSRHSYGSGALSPFIHPPIIPFPPVATTGAAEESAVSGDEAADTSSAAAQPATPSDTTEQQDAGIDRNLGGDEFPYDSEEGGGNKEELRDVWRWGDNEDEDDDGGDGDGGLGLGTIWDVFGVGEDD
jgi:uncharacterized protein YxjI